MSEIVLSEQFRFENTGNKTDFGYKYNVFELYGVVYIFSGVVFVKNKSPSYRFLTNEFLKRKV